jgi:hypothetical protein
MKRRFSTTHFWITVCTLLIATSLAPFSFAQSQSQPAAQAAPIANLYLVRVTRVKPEMAREYRTFMETESIPAYKKGGVKLRNTLSTAIIGEILENISVEPVESLKQFDEQGALRKALGEEGQQAWNTKWLRLIASSHGYIVQLRPELSVNMPKPGTPPTKLAMAVAITVAPGRATDYESFLKSDLLPILQKAYPKGVLTSKILLGGNGNEYRVLIPVDSFADLESGMLAATREGFQKVQSKNAGIVLHAETSILRYVPELSIGPAAQKAENK